MFFTVDLFIASYILTPMAWVFFLFIQTFYPTRRDHWGNSNRKLGALDRETFKMFFEKVAKTPLVWVFIPTVFATPLIIITAFVAFVSGCTSLIMLTIMFYRLKKKEFSFSLYDLASRFKKKGE